MDPDERPDEKQPAKPAPAPTPTPRVESASSWMDPTDLADQADHERARREAEGERPPHY